MDAEKVVCYDRGGVVRELNAIQTQSEDALKQVEMHRKRLEDCQKLRAEFDPMAKKDAEVNARFAKLEAASAA